MPSQDTSQIKEKILSILRIRGPSIPVQVASQVNLSILFTSAFLSELLSEKRIKISNMRVGGTPIYLMSGQEYSLERFSNYLKSREKDAFNLLKEKKSLKDSEQEPAIRVALRAIKDFAIPFKYDGEIYWRYLKTTESEIKSIFEPEVVVKENSKEEQIKEKKQISEKENKLEIFEKIPHKKEKSKKKIKKSREEDDKFFNKIKNFLLEKSIEIMDIESVNKNRLMLRIKEDGKSRLIIAYNKKKLTEQDILKAGKKAQEIGLPYEILSFGEPLKRISKMIEALKGMQNIERIE